MGLTPLDVENIRFRGALAGYNKLEVEHFMQRVAAALEEKLEEIQRLQSQVNSLTRQVEQNREVEDLLKNSVILAQKTCDELISTAHRKAEVIHQEAQAEGQQIKWNFAELKSDKEQFEYAFHGLLSGFMHRLEQGNPALSKPGETAALPAQPAAEPASIPVDEQQPVAPFAGEMPAAEADIQPEILTAELPPSPRLPFRPQPELPRVVLTQAQGQGVDRDADIYEFENAVSEAKTPEPQPWVVPASADETSDTELGGNGQLDGTDHHEPEEPTI